MWATSRSAAPDLCYSWGDLNVHCHRCRLEFSAPGGAVEAKCPECGARITLTAAATRPAVALARVAEADPDRLLGQVLGGYRLTEVLGGGGMGTVYEAERVEPAEGPERAAVKVLSFAFAHDPDFVARFRREADALIRLRHPHLIEVYQKGEHQPADGGPTAYYFVMERFDGEDLRRVLAKGQLSVETALAIVRQAADGLAYAHEHGIVHRDIKPGNILVRGDPADGGLVKVVDFGVAQLASLGHTLTNLTRSDLILGTFNYMSPEQRVDASRIDHRADIYALGVVAYELLTGSLPMGAFEAPSELRPDLSRGADRALMAALRRDPAQRPASVLQFARSLALSARPGARAGWLAPLAAAVVLSGIGGGALWWAETMRPVKVTPKATKVAQVAKVEYEDPSPAEAEGDAEGEAAQATDAPPEPTEQINLATIDTMANAMIEDADYARKLARPAPSKKAVSKPRPKRKAKIPTAVDAPVTPEISKPTRKREAKISTAVDAPAASEVSKPTPK